MFVRRSMEHHVGSELGEERVNLLLVAHVPDDQDDPSSDVVWVNPSLTERPVRISLSLRDFLHRWCAASFLLDELLAPVGVKLPAPAQYGVGMLFMPKNAADREGVKKELAKIIADEGQRKPETVERIADYIAHRAAKPVTRGDTRPDR